MSYEGKHRRVDDGQLAGGTVKKVAGLTGLAASAAAVAVVGMGAGTANADGGILHNLFSPKKPSSTSSNLNSNSVTKTTVKVNPTLVTVKPTPSPNRITNYFTPGQTGTAIKGICFFNC
jgi:hypothetical protein